MRATPPRTRRAAPPPPPEGGSRRAARRRPRRRARAAARRARGKPSPGAAALQPCRAACYDVANRLTRCIEYSPSRNARYTHPPSHARARCEQPHPRRVAAQLCVSSATCRGVPVLPAAPSPPSHQCAFSIAWHPAYRAPVIGLPHTCHTPTAHPPHTYHTPTAHLPYTYHTLAKDLPYTYHTPTIHLPYTYHTLTLHLPHTYLTPTIHLPYTRTLHLPYTYLTPTLHLPYTYHTHVPYTYLTPTLHLPYTYHITCASQVQWRSQHFQSFGAPTGGTDGGGGACARHVQGERRTQSASPSVRQSVCVRKEGSKQVRKQASKKVSRTTT